jgi:cytochrome P450
MTDVDGFIAETGRSGTGRMPPSPRGSVREMVRDPLNFFLNMTREYGDVVCYRPAPDMAYLVNHPDDIRHVLVDNNRNYSKATYSNLVFKKLVGDGLITLEGETWRQHRRLMQPAFHHGRLEALDGMIVKATDEMLGRWERRYAEGLPVDIAREMASLTLTVTTRALFGVDLGDEVNTIGEWVNQAAVKFEKPSTPQVQEASREVRAIVERIVRQRKENFEDRGDLLSSMIQARDEETRLMLDERSLCDEVMTLLIAGYETTANALTWTWYLLSQNPWAVGQMREEVQGVLGNERRPATADLDKMPFTRMVLDESLRLFPPAWILGRKALGPDEIGGYHVGAGTIMAICVYTVHRHPGFWEQPEVFNPLRFSPEADLRRHRYAYIPFGAGPRQCIGNNFGLLEACLAMACVAQRFELRIAPGSQVQPLPMFVLRPNRDLFMTLHR